MATMMLVLLLTAATLAWVAVAVPPVQPVRARRRPTAEELLAAYRAERGADRY